MDLSKRRTFEEGVAAIIRRNIDPGAFQWLEEKGAVVKSESMANGLNAAFAAVPRKTGKHLAQLSVSEQEQVLEAGDGFSLNGWTIDRLCRLWLLMQVGAEEKEAYRSKIESLFKAAEMNEAVALYSSLYLLHFPESWQLRAAEGIRSNIGIVLEAIMYDNPYPHRYLDEPQWNQLVLKAFFTEKDVNLILGLDERANKELASVLVDYARERWAAHRDVNPLLWRLIGPFIDAENFGIIEKLASSSHPREQKAAALACFQSNYRPARELLEKQPGIETSIKENKFTWHSL